MSKYNVTSRQQRQKRVQQLSVLRSTIVKKKTKKNRPTDPIFFVHVSGNNNIFFLRLTENAQTQPTQV